MMLRVLIKLSECKTGDILAQDVFSKNGALVVPKNTPINAYIVSKLTHLGLDQILISPGSKSAEEAHNSSYRVFLAEYRKNLSVIKDIIGALSVGHNLDVQKTSSIVDSLYKETKEVSNIIKCLNDIRNLNEYLYTHSLNVALYSMLIAKWLGLPDNEVKDVMKAGLLHDIGKVKVPAHIINKEGKLTEEEFEEIKNHPMNGYLLIKGNPGITDDILQGVLLHHEKYDGTGYPFKVNYKQVGTYPKIIAIADVYDALNSDTVYRERITPFEAFKVLEKSGAGHFDLSMLKTFVQNIAYHYIGYEVVTNTGQRGKVLNVVPHKSFSPIIWSDNKIVDLSSDSDVYTVDLIS
ncbi:MAG: HD domain-containing phosphohydrolase [Bacillota bacterium]